MTDQRLPKDHSFASSFDVQWDDLRFPATAINPPGQVNDPDWDNTKGGWLFAASSTEQLWLIAQLPHAWKEGSILKPHVHWEKSTSAAGNVFWELTYSWSSINTARTGETIIDQDTPVVASDILDVQQLSAFPDIDATGKKISDMLVMKLARVGGNAADTYGADARLLEFDIHVQIDSRGSIGEFDKDGIT